MGVGRESLSGAAYPPRTCQRAMSPSSRLAPFHRDLHGHSRPPQVPATRSCLDAYVRGLWSKGTVLPLRDLHVVAKSPSRIGRDAEGLE